MDARPFHGLRTDGREKTMKEFFEEVSIETILFEQNADIITDSNDVNLPDIPL